MRLLRASILITLAIVTASGQNPDSGAPQSQTPTVAPEVKLELNQTATAYRRGDFAEALRHAERAVSLDPANLTAATFLARVRHQRYKPGDETPENLERAQAAISAYQRLLTLDPQNEEAYKAISVLYSATHQEELLRDWILQRALDPQLSNDKRVEAYVVLAGKNWDCSYKFTELPEVKTTAPDQGKASVVYKMPIDAAGFQRAKQCVADGMQMAEAALALDSSNESAWSYKANLFLEQAKFAEMEGLDSDKATYLKEASQAQAQAGKMSEEQRKKGAPDKGLELFPRPLPPPPNPRKPRF